jgi:two-component system OmpR family sensor kinase
VGLLAAGAGTMGFLRNTLIQNLDSALQQVATGEAASSMLEVTVEDGVVAFSANESAATTDYFIAVYSPEGELRALVGPRNAPATPPVPDTYTLEKAIITGTEPFTLTDPETGRSFHASVAPFEVDGVTDFYTQLIAVPLAPTERVVTAFVGIYSILALLIIVASALLTRWLVTLTFRGLGQVEATAMSIAAGDFSQRLADVVPGTEVGRLKAAINAMLGRVDAAIRQRDATVRQMRRFIGDASHELRTPLVTVRGYAELYRMGAIRSDEDVAQSMERIEKEAIRMGVLVEDLLALARLDERRDVELSPIDLRPLARDAALDLRAASPQREVTVDDTTAEGARAFTVDPIVASAAPPAAASDPAAPGTAPEGSKAPGASKAPAAAKSAPDSARRRATPATSAIAIAGATISRLRRRPRPGDPVETDAVTADPVDTTAPIVLGEENRIRQVIANLLGNARRFTADDSPIGLRVGADRAAGVGWIEIIDHGEGIPEQIRDQIFQRFWRADNSRTRETGGSGLGLSIVASIVDTLHGTVTVVDTPGGGATFRVALPLAPEPEASEPVDTQTQPLPRP